MSKILAPKRWSKPASIAFSLLFIAIMCFSFLPMPVQIGNFSLGGAGVARATTETTFYPSVYGTVYQTYSSGAGVAIATICAAAGNGHGESSIWSMYLNADTTGRTNLYNQLYRGVASWDTSSIPAGANITSATVSYYGEYHSNLLGGTPSINIYPFTPAGNTTIVNGDYAQCAGLNTAAYSDTAILVSNISDVAWNTWTLNAAGLAAINIGAGAYTHISWRTSFDVTRTGMTWAANQGLGLGWDDDLGSLYTPKLVVTYIIPPDISNTPSSWSVGVVQPSQTIYAKTGLTPPSFPLAAGNCTGSVTNLSSFTLDYLTVVITDFSGGTAINIVSTAPGANEARVMILVGNTTDRTGAGNDTDGIYLTNAAQNWVADVAADEEVYWELKLETGSRNTFAYGVYTATLTFTTDPAGDSETVTITFTWGDRRRGIGIAPAFFY